MSVTVVDINKKEPLPVELADLNCGEVVEFPSDKTKGLVYYNTKTEEKEILLLFADPRDYQTADGYLGELAKAKRLGHVKNITIEVCSIV